MTYIVNSTEKTKGKASDFETRALLYLMALRKDSEEMNVFVIDFFNDVTSLNDDHQKLWDVQSKGEKNVSADKLGKELVTLFKNYVSLINFDYYILSVEGISDNILIDASVDEYKTSNIKSVWFEKVKNSLKAEALIKTYIDNSLVTDVNIASFLDNVIIKENNHEKNHYIKLMAPISERNMPTDDYLDLIFKEIRDMQMSKKNSLVEGEVIQNVSDFLNYERHIYKNEITLMVINRLVNSDIMNNSIPVSFMPELVGLQEIETRDLLEDCQLDSAKLLFNKNLSRLFWGFMNGIIEEINSGVTNLNTISSRVIASNNELCSQFDEISVKFFISNILEGLVHGN